MSRTRIPVSSSSARLWLKASPKGKRSGFTVLSDGAGGRVTVAVLPKPWSETGQSVYEYVHVPGSTTHVTTFETGVVAINSSVNALGSLAMSLADISAVNSDLLTIGDASAHLVDTVSTLGDPFGHLVDLMLLAERGSLTDRPLNFEGTFVPSLLRLLAHERLLRTVEDLIFRARPRYVEQTELLGIPRGRLDAKSLLLSINTGFPQVESTFDELSTDTPILQIVASALRVVASDRLPPKISELRPRLQSRAIQLLRHLSTVTLIDRERALLLAEAIWVGPFDQIWKPAIDAAVPVLQEWAVSPEGGSENTEAVAMQISTEKFWEQCLELALRSAFGLVAVSSDGNAGNGVSVPAPWDMARASSDPPSEPRTGSFPDFMFRARHRTIVADAKYKLGIGSAPGSSDGYQLFAYSHLATLNGTSSDLAVLLYPARQGEPNRHTELKRLRDFSYPLWLVRLPFPRTSDIRNQQRWNLYIANLANQLRIFADEWCSNRHDITEQ